MSGFVLFDVTFDMIDDIDERELKNRLHVRRFLFFSLFLFLLASNLTAELFHESPEALQYVDLIISSATRTNIRYMYDHMILQR